MQFRLRRTWFRLKRYGKKILLLPSRNNTISKVFSDIDRQLKPTAIANTGDFSPSNGVKSSWFGNIFVAKQGETWPFWKNRPLMPLAQFNLSESPYVPERLKQFKLITVFIDADNLPYEKPIGEGWLVRGYESLDELIEINRPEITCKIKQHPIQWKKRTEGPGIETAGEFTDMADFLVFDRNWELYYKRYKPSSQTKLGGFPDIVQYMPEFGLNNYVFQIGSDYDSNWMWGDMGIGYFGITETGEWQFTWQCS